MNLRLLFRAVLVSAGAALFGGFAAGFAIGLMAFASNWRIPTNPLAYPVGVLLLLESGAIGALCGVFVGFLPTIALGSALGAVRSRAPFNHLTAWLLTSGSAGAIVYKFNLSPLGLAAADNIADWFVAWVAGGAIAMAAFRKFDLFGRPYARPSA